MNTSLPPPPAQAPRDPRADMAVHHHQPQQPYRLPGPGEWNQAPPQSDPYRAQQPPPGYMNQHHQPPAPRQRTAIACRYCRRRKVNHRKTLCAPRFEEEKNSPTPRSAARVSKPPTTAAAPTACASTRTASSRPCRPRRRLSCPPTPSGAAWDSLHPCTVPTASHCHPRSTATPMPSSHAPSSRAPRRHPPTICPVPQVPLQVRTKLIPLMVPLPPTMTRAVMR